MLRGSLLALCLTLPTTLPATAADLTAELDAYVTQVVLDWDVPGLAIAVVKDGELVFAKGYGVREQGVEGAVDEHTLFAIGSTTKAMTVATVGLLVDEGKIGWDDPVSKHLPGFALKDPYVSREVTVRDLLTHRAGLGNADLLWYGSNRSRESIIEKLALVEPAYSMRDGFIYQNIMYIAAGEMAAKVAGTSWESWLDERIFTPLEMERTVANLSETAGRENVAAPHYRIDGKIEVIENASVDAAAPAGAVWSSVSEMSNWLRMVLDEGKWGEEQVLSEAVVTEMLKPQTLLDLTAFYPAMRLIEPHWTTYGLGWFQADYEGRAVSFHTGSIDGMAAIVGIIPDEELGVVVLENIDHAECRHALLWKVFDMWGGKTDGRDWSAELKPIYDEIAAAGEARREQMKTGRIEGTSPSLALEAYAGTYSHEIYDQIEVRHEDGELRLITGPSFNADLGHWHHDTFLVRFDQRWRGEGLATFVLDSAGAVSKMELFGMSWDRAPQAD